MSNRRDLIVIPTYNERENIKNLIPKVLSTVQGVNILVVDDNSPDGTAQEVKRLKEIYPGQVHLLVREKKSGLGRAYVAGFEWGLSQNFDVICEMDADFSHRPEDLKTILESMNQYDVVIGSRWVPRGGTINWSPIRKLISRGGSFYSRMILRYAIKDWTGGFNCWKSQVLKAIRLETIKSEGYSFQIELKFRALRLGFNVGEVPITFEERRAGQSKMSSKIMFEAMYRVWQLRRNTIEKPI